MKRMIRYESTENRNTELLEIVVDVIYSNDAINSSTILDLNDSAFFDFESNILTACEIHDFELEDSYRSNRANSVSQYYIYTKTSEDGSKLRVFIKLRVSDHSAPDRTLKGEAVTHKKLADANVTKEAKQLASEKYNQTRGYRARFLDIIFDDEHFTSYESALRAIEDSLDEFDAE